MGKVTGFLEYERLEEGYEPVPKRVKNYKEFVVGLNADQAKTQAARCMDCGTPFCQSPRYTRSLKSGMMLFTGQPLQQNGVPQSMQRAACVLA